MADPKLVKSSWARTIMFKCAGSPSTVIDLMRANNQQLSTVSADTLRSYLLDHRFAKLKNQSPRDRFKQRDTKGVNKSRPKARKAVCTECQWHSNRHHHGCSKYTQNGSKPVHKK